MRFRPCIDLHAGKVKQIVGSTLGKNRQPVTNFESTLSAAHYAERYKNDNLPGGHVIMLGSGNREAALDALSHFPGGLQVGGGITPENAAQFLDAGASHVIVTSYVFEKGNIRWDRLQKLTDTVGREHLVLDLSCKKRGDNYRIVTDRWQYASQEKISEHLLSKLEKKCSEFLIHAAHVEGMRSGIDEELVTLLGAIAPIPTTYAGGVRSLADLELLAHSGKNRIDVTIGSALDLFGGSLSYQETVKWFAQQQHSHAKQSNFHHEKRLPQCSHFLVGNDNNHNL